MPESPRSSREDPARFASGLSAEEFCARLQASFRTHWLIAVSIVREPAAAEDVVQEAALIALGKLSDFTPGTNFNAWVGRMVRYVALNYARKEQKRRSPSLESVGDPIDAAGVERSGAKLSATFRGSLDARIERELFAIHETARACLLLRTVEGLSYENIAELLEIPEGTAMSHVHRTRLLLRERLSDFAPDGAGWSKNPS